MSMLLSSLAKIPPTYTTAYMFTIIFYEQKNRSHVMHLSKREVPSDVRNSKVRKQDKFRRDWSQHKNTCKSKNGIEPDVRRSKRLVLACRHVANVLWIIIAQEGKMSNS